MTNNKIRLLMGIVCSVLVQTFSVNAASLAGLDDTTAHAVSGAATAQALVVLDDKTKVKGATALNIVATKGTVWVEISADTTVGILHCMSKTTDVYVKDTATALNSVFTVTNGVVHGSNATGGIKIWTNGATPVMTNRYLQANDSRDAVTLIAKDRDNETTTKKSVTYGLHAYYGI